MKPISTDWKANETVVAKLRRLRSRTPDSTKLSENKTRTEWAEGSRPGRRHGWPVFVCTASPESLARESQITVGMTPSRTGTLMLQANSVWMGLTVP